MPTILFLNKAPPYRHTGAEQVVWAVGTHLAESGWDVHFLTPDGDPPEVPNVTFHEVATPDSFFAEKAAFFLKGIPAYRRVRRSLDPDLVYDNASPFPFPYAYLADRDRIVTKVHAVYGWSAFANKHHPVTKVGTLLGEQLYRAMDGERMLAVSESTRTRLAANVRKNPGAITVVNNGIDVSRFEYTFDPDGPVLSLCELTPRKNVELLLRAWGRLESEAPPDRELIVAGDGPRRDALEGFANELGLSTVDFRGYVPEAEKMDLLRESFCYVLPTRMEGFGLANLEAMAVGCVVVSTDAPGVRDYFVDGTNGYAVPSGDVKALADRLGSLLDSPGEAEAVAWNGRKTAEQYDVADAVRRERRVLEGMVDAS